MSQEYFFSRGWKVSTAEDLEWDLEGRQPSSGNDTWSLTNTGRDQMKWPRGKSLRQQSPEAIPWAAQVPLQPLPGRNIPLTTTLCWFKQFLQGVWRLEILNLGRGFLISSKEEFWHLLIFKRYIWYIYWKQWEGRGGEVRRSKELVCLVK